VSSLVIMSDGSFPFLQWNAHTQKMETHPKKASIPMTQLLEMIQKLMQLMDEDQDIVLKYHSMKTRQSTSTVIPWMLEVSLRQDDFFQTLLHLTHNSAWQLICCRMRQHSMQQSKQADHLQKMMRK